MVCDSLAPTLVVIGERGAIILFDNRRMGAISQLQQAQYGADFRTSDSVPADYVQMAASVPGVKALSIHVPVYYGDDLWGGMGAPMGNGTSETGATTCRTATCAPRSDGVQRCRFARRRGGIRRPRPT